MSIAPHTTPQSATPRPAIYSVAHPSGARQRLFVCGSGPTLRCGALIAGIALAEASNEACNLRSQNLSLGRMTKRAASLAPRTAHGIDNNGYARCAIFELPGSSHCRIPCGSYFVAALQAPDRGPEVEQLAGPNLRGLRWRRH